MEALDHVERKQAPGAGQHDLPQQPDHNGGHHRRHEQKRHQKIPTLDTLVEHHCANEAQHELDRYGDEHEDECDAYRVPEAAVTQKLQIVGEADEVRDAAKFRGMEAEINGVDKGNERDDAQRDHRRRYEEIRIPDAMSDVMPLCAGDGNRRGFCGHFNLALFLAFLAPRPLPARARTCRGARMASLAFLRFTRTTAHHSRHLVQSFNISAWPFLAASSGLILPSPTSCAIAVRAS